MDKRIGESHMKYLCMIIEKGLVACFPKDSLALAKYSIDLDSNEPLLSY